MLKRAQLYYQGPDQNADEAKSFLEEHGVMVLERDIVKKPLSRKELALILGYHDPKHYLDITSPAYAKKKLDKKLPSRSELLDLIIEHPDLLRNPIILSGRLMTIGNNRKQLIEMFQITISDNGHDNNEGESKKKK